MNRQPIRVHGDPVIKDVFFDCKEVTYKMPVEEDPMPCGVVCIDGMCFGADHYKKLIDAGVKYWNKHGEVLEENVEYRRVKKWSRRFAYFDKTNGEQLIKLA